MTKNCGKQIVNLQLTEKQPVNVQSPDKQLIHLIVYIKINYYYFFK